MLEQLFKLIQGEAQQEIINNPAIPNEANNHAVGLATDSIFSGLQGALANGGVAQILNLFGGKSAVNGSNPLVGGIMNNLVQGLMGKFGMNNGIASGIASSLIPNVLSKLVGRTSDPNDNSFDINNIVSALVGGNGNQAGAVQVPGQSGGIDFNNILNSITGGKKVQPQPDAAHNDDGFGMDDIMRMLGGGGGQQQQAAQPQEGGGMADILQMLTGGAKQQQQAQQQQSGGGIMDLLKGVMGS
ncbi:MAG: hypothetical protein RL660_2913 [Bacteroidota bacterium]|jgi:hypothetical protein